MKVYVIRSLKDGRFYVGIAQYVVRRVVEHNRGKTKSTKGYRPWSLVFVENFTNTADARKREKYLKSGCGKEYIKHWWSQFNSKQGAT